MQPVYGSEVDPVSGVMVDFGNDEAIKKEKDIHSDSVVVRRVMARKTVGDMDEGGALRERISDLIDLLKEYRSGRIKERL